MAPKTIRAIAAGGYLALAACVVLYELSIRLFDRGNSEFAGMLSVLVTLPGSILSIAAGRVVGVRVGDSDLSFVTLLSLAAVVNAALVWLVAGLFTRRS